MTKYWLAQCLCGPNRHAILGGLSPDPDQSEHEVRADLQANVENFLTLGGNPRCGLCGSPRSAWQYEVRRTRPFADWETAVAFVKQAEADQLATRAVFDALGRSFDSRKPSSN